MRVKELKDRLETCSDNSEVVVDYDFPTSDVVCGTAKVDSVYERSGEFVIDTVMIV